MKTRTSGFEGQTKNTKAEEKGELSLCNQVANIKLLF